MLIVRILFIATSRRTFDGTAGIHTYIPFVGFEILLNKEDNLQDIQSINMKGVC